MWSGPGDGCGVTVFPVGNTSWTGASVGGFITHTFTSAQTSVNVSYYHINSDDYGAITVNGGGAVTVSMIAGCVGLVGNVVGPYTGSSSYGPCEINVSSTVPFTTLTLTNVAATSGFIAGCTSVIPSLNISLGPDTTLCLGDSLILDATTLNCTYLWQDASTDSTYTVTQAGTYWVQITDDVGTTASDTIVVSYFQLPTVSLPADTLLCAFEELLLNVTQPNVTYLWQNASTQSTFTVDTTGVYWVEITDQCGFIAADTIVVDYMATPTVDLGPDLLICDDEVVVLSPVTTSVVDTYFWNDSTTNSTLLVSLPGSYWVNVTNSCGSANDVINIQTEACLSVLEMPNVFTPNQDASNNLFVPVSIVNILNANITILNRWGDIMYENDDLTAGWNGTYKGNPCAEGTYYWLVDYTTVKGEQFTIHGFVQLVR